jgi:hypothetical protein
MLKWGDMTEMGYPPVHFPYWMQGDKGSFCIWANRSVSVDITYSIKVVLRGLGNIV